MLQPPFRGRAIAAGFIALAVFAMTAIITTLVAISPASGNVGEGISTFSGSTSGAVVYSTNSSTGTAVEGVTGTVAGGKALWGVANNALHAGTGVRASAYGPNSFSLFGEALNTDKTHPSYGLYATSKSSYAVYATTAVAGLTSLYAINTDATSTTSHAIKGQSAGNAITGISTQANGVVGQASATPTPMPSAAFALAGVLGKDTSTGINNAGVAGTSTNGFGVAGTSTNVGVFGQSSIGYGVRGDGSSIGIGVFGKSGSNVGVMGLATSGYGMFGESTSGYGVRGESSSGYGVRGESTSLAGVWGISGSSNGVLAQSAATPLPNATTLPNANNIFTAALAVEGTGGAPLIIARGTGANDVMSLDNSGNLILSGTSSPSGTPLVVHRTTLGRDVITYSGHQSLPSIEDFGEAQLVNGQAYVRLDPTFAAIIDPRANYLVFLTPLGDNRGLYVTQRFAAGFAVRESQAGHSSLAFDYRIVAKPLDSTARRLPVMRWPQEFREPKMRLPGHGGAGFIPPSRPARP